MSSPVINQRPGKLSRGIADNTNTRFDHCRVENSAPDRVAARRRNGVGGWLDDTPIDGLDLDPSLVCVVVRFTGDAINLQINIRCHEFPLVSSGGFAIPAW